ncbi:MAG: DUF1553 domain-containing protein, partial [Planctomycetota bacterium]
RWNSSDGFVAGSGWHHIAVTYTFGKGNSVRGYIDGKPTGGRWDLGGESNEAPVVDNDEVWIGTALGGNKTNSFQGAIDNVAVYRTALSSAAIRRHVQIDESVRPAVDVFQPNYPTELGVVSVRVLEGVPDLRSWKRRLNGEVTETYEQREFALSRTPRKYAAGGWITDRSRPFALRLLGRLKVEPGRYELLLRSFGGARLLLDEKQVVTTRFLTRNANGHEKVPTIENLPATPILPVGHSQSLETIELGGEHSFRVEVFVGGKGLRAEIGELAAAIRPAGSKGPFKLLGSDAEWTEESWETTRAKLSDAVAQLETQRRREAAAEMDSFWQKRHDAAREFAHSLKPVSSPPACFPTATHGAIDEFINAKLQEADQLPRALVDDFVFLRRSSLDTRGIVPTAAEIRTFAEATKSLSLRERRAKWIDQMLADVRWADHWVAYWQDALAENPGILKPKLNNTGPFRYFIRDAFADNKAMDRFASELIWMKGSRYGGGPAGFAMATENDLPMAAKAHVIGTAFLGLDMKCARCHDAPYHPYAQQDLFGLAAMLGRGPVTVPKSSTVPGTPDDHESLIVEVNLKPGQKIPPAWPFKELSRDLSDEWLLKPADSRERLAATVTAPTQTRFPRVIVNRLWKRWLGWGFVEPVDDWDAKKASHPELLNYLARELATHDYDLKHVARLILNSHTYQRVAAGSPSAIPEPKARLFAGPAQRRMSAEQIVDSFFVISGKSLASEMLNLDVDGRRPVETFLNLGIPERAWEFASLSNERDRPALSMPMAQNITDVLKTFGWRETRQDPLTVREGEPTILQPLVVANGVVAQRAITLSDDHRLTETCLETKSPNALVEELFLEILGRSPNAAEEALGLEWLGEGFNTRVVPGAKKLRRTMRRHAVSWSNHLNAEATKLKLEDERLARQGDPPTKRLRNEWRERAEDFAWSLLNLPEFVFVP